MSGLGSYTTGATTGYSDGSFDGALGQHQHIMGMIEADQKAALKRQMASLAPQKGPLLVHHKSSYSGGGDSKAARIFFNIGAAMLGVVAAGVIIHYVMRVLCLLTFPWIVNGGWQHFIQWHLVMSFDVNNSTAYSISRWIEGLTPFILFALLSWLAYRLLRVLARRVAKGTAYLRMNTTAWWRSKRNVATN